MVFPLLPLSLPLSHTLCLSLTRSLFLSLSPSLAHPRSLTHSLPLQERFAAGLEMTEDNSCMPAFPSLGSIDSEATSACPSHPLLDRGYQRYVSRARRCSGNPRIIRVVHRHRQPMQVCVYSTQACVSPTQGERDTRVRETPGAC